MNIQAEFHTVSIEFQIPHHRRGLRLRIGRSARVHLRAELLDLGVKRVLARITWLNGEGQCRGQCVTYVLAGSLIVPVIAKVTIDVHAGAGMTRITMTVLAPETILQWIQLKYLLNSINNKHNSN